MATTSHPETALGPVLTLSQLAGQLGVTVQTLYDLRSQGRGRASTRSRTPRPGSPAATTG